jgi:hypothetical protein
MAASFHIYSVSSFIIPVIRRYMIRDTVPLSKPEISKQTNKEANKPVLLHGVEIELSNFPTAS